jgi:hypothetical protein
MAWDWKTLLAGGGGSVGGGGAVYVLLEKILGGTECAANEAAIKALTASNHKLTQAFVDFVAQGGGQ